MIDYFAPFPGWAGSTQIIFDDERGITSEWVHWPTLPSFRTTRCVRAHAWAEALRERGARPHAKALIVYWNPHSPRRGDGTPAHLHLLEIHTESS